MEVTRLVVGPISTNCYILHKLGQVALVDPGAEADMVINRIEEIGCGLSMIINTHFHFDHIGANEDIRRKYNSPILIHRDEKKYIKHYLVGREIRIGRPVNSEARIIAGFEPDRLLGDNEIIKIGNTNIKVVHTPGHSPGSICLWGKNFIFTGDTLFKDGYGRVDLPGSSAGDMDRSLAKLEKIIKPGFMVYPGHGDTYQAL